MEFLRGESPRRLDKLSGVPPVIYIMDEQFTCSWSRNPWSDDKIEKKENYQEEKTSTIKSQSLNEDRNVWLSSGGHAQMKWTREPFQSMNDTSNMW